MVNHEFNTVAVSDGSEMDIYVAMPEGQESHPAILVFQEAFGVTNHIQNIAERLCNEGYAVVAPDLFHRTVKRLQAAYTDFPTIKQHFEAVTKEGLTFDIQASYNWLQDQEFVIKDKLGSIGFCLGGRVAFLANVVLPVSAGVSYYGGGLEQLADEATNLHGSHLFYWGGQDQHISQDAINAIVNAVKTAGKDYTNVSISDADHGFNCDERESYHPRAANEAWAHTLAFLENRLK